MSNSARRTANDDLGTDAWEALLRVHAALVPVLAGEVEDATGLPLSWYDVLLELNSASGRRLRMQDLGERVVLSRTRVSRIVDDMIRRGFVTKESDPTDGRASLAIITANGRRALRRAAPVYLSGIQRHFTTHLESEELKTIQSGFHRILAKHHRAYEVWMKQDGTTRPAPSLLEVEPKDASAVLIMRSGPYKDRNSLDLLKESAEWVEERIFGAIRRAGFDPDEDRNLVNFQKRPPVEKGLLSR